LPRSSCCPPLVGTPPPLSLPRSLLHAAPHPGPPPLPASPASASKGAGHGATLSSFSPLALLRPRPNEHTSRPHRRPSRRGPRCLSDHRDPPGETHQSAAISRFGAALTSLVAPGASRSDRQPSLLRGSHRVPPPRAAPPPHS
jgi:hypothetical protein